MTITCLLLQPGQNFTATPNTDSSTLEEVGSPSRACDEETLSMGYYRDIPSLNKVLSHGPQIKSDVDGIIELRAGAGHLREDIVYYTKEPKKLPNTKDENRSYIMDMGVKASRLAT